VDAFLRREDYDRAIAAADVALSQGSRSPEVHRLRGLARVGRGDFPGAIDDYSQALALAPGLERAHRQRGWAYLLADSPELALRDFEHALQVDPDDADAYAGRGKARVRLGRIDDGLADAEKALKQSRSSARIGYLAAQTYAQAAEATRRGRVATRISLAHEARASDLLRLAIEQTAPAARERFWRKTILVDGTLRPLLRNPRIVQRLEAILISAPGTFARKTASAPDHSR
jgi:tetratricopeptide (TPR) repeat protein